MNMKKMLGTAALSLLLAASSQAAPTSFDFEYRLQNIVDGLEFEYAAILDARLVLNNNGQIAFQARPAYDPNFPTIQQPNIYMNGAVGSFSTLVPGSIFSTDDPSMNGLPFDFNDSGTLAFGVPAPCCNESVGTKLYSTTNGSSFKLLIGGQDLSAYSESYGMNLGLQFNHLSLNNSGQIAISRTDDAGAGMGDDSIIVLQPFGGSPPVVQSGETARIVTGGIARTVATSSSLPFAQFMFPQINNFGQVAYHGTLGGAPGTGGEGLFSVDGPGAFSIITTDTPLDSDFCCSNSKPTFAYNDQGVAAYMRYVGQSVTQRELVLSDGTVVAAEEDPANPGSGFGSIGGEFSLNNLNQVAFMASSPGSPFGPFPDTLYFWDNGELVRILGLGDIIQGAYSVGAIEIAPGSLNDNGQVAFVARYDFIDDPIFQVTALVVAQPDGGAAIPEPTGLAALLGLSIAGLARRRPRRSI